MTTRIKQHGEITEYQWKSDHWATKVPKWTSSYLLDGLLIDTSATKGKQEILKWVSQLHEDHQIKKIFLTHYHEDHVGGAKILQNSRNLPIYCRSITNEELQAPQHYRWYRQVYWGDPVDITVKLNLVKDRISSATGKYNFDLIPIPGHSPDLTALLDREHQILFASDGLMKRYKMIFGGPCKDIQENIREIHDSQQKLYDLTEGLDQLKIFVSHDKVYPRAFLKEKIEEIETLHTKAHELKEKFETQGVKREKTLIGKILKGIWPKGEDQFVKIMSHGELCMGNLVKSLLEWPMT